MISKWKINGKIITCMPGKRKVPPPEAFGGGLSREESVMEVYVNNQLIFFTHAYEFNAGWKYKKILFRIWDHKGELLSSTTSRPEYERAMQVTMSFWSVLYEDFKNRRKAA